MQMVSSWTTYYVPGEGNGFGNNINIGAWDIDGRNLAPGEWFSFWGSIGPVTVERGYQLRRRDHQRPQRAGRRHRRRHLLDLDDDVQRRAADRPRDGRSARTTTTTSIATRRASTRRSPWIDNYVQDMTFRNDTEYPIVIRGFGGSGLRHVPDLERADRPHASSSPIR